MTYQPKVYRKQGGDELVVASGGKITVETGGIIAANGGTQAAATVAPAATAATSSTPFGYSEAQANAIVTWIIAADAALKAAGIVAAS